MESEIDQSSIHHLLGWGKEALKYFWVLFKKRNNAFGFMLSLSLFELNEMKPNSNIGVNI